MRLKLKCWPTINRFDIILLQYLGWRAISTPISFTYQIMLLIKCSVIYEACLAYAIRGAHTLSIYSLPHLSTPFMPCHNTGRLKDRACWGREWLLVRCLYVYSDHTELALAAGLSVVLGAVGMWQAADPTHADTLEWVWGAAEKGPDNRPCLKSTS